MCANYFRLKRRRKKKKRGENGGVFVWRRSSLTGFLDSSLPHCLSAEIRPPGSLHIAIDQMVHVLFNHFHSKRFCLFVYLYFLLN